MITGTLVINIRLVPARLHHPVRHRFDGHFPRAARRVDHRVLRRVHDHEHLQLRGRAAARRRRILVRRDLHGWNDPRLPRRRDHGDGAEALLERLRAKGLAGATVLRGVAGFGASSVVHTDKVLRLSLDLPLIVEVVETEEAIQAVLPDLDDMIGGGLITLERARVIMYRPANVRPSQQELHRIEGLEPE
ncbi:MAG TPA: DUF190 domain-containing protein [Gemmatimonadales bacterium]|nr:DUF190 domain-containing protein [Gemmatimonadales bacterium]